MSDGTSKTTGAQGIIPRQNLAVINPTDQYLGMQLPQRRHQTVPWMLMSKEIMLAVSIAIACFFNEADFSL